MKPIDLLFPCIIACGLFVPSALASTSQETALARAQAAWVVKAQTLALTGSGKSARELMGNFKDDEAQSNYWMQIGAENGDLISQYNFGWTLSRNPDQASQTRARFWLKKAASRGYVDAKKLLARMSKPAPK